MSAGLFCKDCRFIVPGPNPMCSHPTSVFPGKLSLVTGERKPDLQLDCENARRGFPHGDFCGPGGQYWEAADTPGEAT